MNTKYIYLHSKTSDLQVQGLAFQTSLPQAISHNIYLY